MEEDISNRLMTPIEELRTWAINCFPTRAPCTVWGALLIVPFIGAIHEGAVWGSLLAMLLAIAHYSDHAGSGMMGRLSLN